MWSEALGYKEISILQMQMLLSSLRHMWVLRSHGAALTFQALHTE